MSDSPLAKKQKTRTDDDGQIQSNPTISPIPPVSGSSLMAVKSSPTRQDRLPSPTPRKLVLGSPEKKYAYSQPSTSSSLSVPNLQPPNVDGSRGRRFYSQSPPRSPHRSPNRSPTRRLELIQLSPVKNNRAELQKIYDEKNKDGNQCVHRLCIDKLSLHNFKSYAGTQVIGPFHTSFSAVVGPNGSGKSNVIDSMLFVFGFRANKMRQGKLSDLIHKSEAYPNLESCSVDIHFRYVVDESDGTTRSDDEKPPMVITRKAFKNNSSKYYIDGKESNYTEVTQLLRDQGIDLDHKRFLILQGEVESISQMKPKAERESDDGLLEYLEDIIGTAKYKAGIEAGLVEIDTLNDVCVEKENRFELVEKEKNSLESGKDEALEFLEKEKSLILLKSKLAQYHIWQDQRKLSETLGKISELNEHLGQEKAKYDQFQREVAQLRERCNDFKKQIVKLDKEHKDLTSKRRLMDREKTSMEEKQRNLDKKSLKAEKLLKSTENSMADSKHKLEELNNSQTQYKEELLQLNESLLEERSKLDEIKLSLRDKTSEISAEIANHERDLEPWNAQLQEKKSQMKLTESQIAILKESKEKMVQNIIQLKTEIEAFAEKNNVQEIAIHKLQCEQANILKQIDIGEKECGSASSKLGEMKKVLISHRQRSMEARSTLSNVENKNKVLSALTRLQRSGRIAGFHGRLGDLGTIDDMYDVAISTACPRLDDIVVDNVECGQQCIEHLRKNKLGYARFIILDKLRKFNLSPIQTPETVPRLFDLVRSKNEKILPAFYSVLRDTLVVSDLKQANRVAYGKRRFRVVTLDGKLIDTSGTLSGGGTHVMKGLMKSKQQPGAGYTPEEVQNIEKELNEREKNFHIAIETFHDMEEALKKFKDREPEIEVEIAKRRLDIESSSTELKLKQERLKELETDRDGGSVEDRELADAESKLQVLSEEYDEIENETKNKQQLINSLKEKIMKIGGTKLQLQNSKVNSINEQISIISSKQKKDRTATKKAENDLKRLEKQCREASNDIESCNLEVSKINVLNTELEAKIYKLDTSLNETESLKEEVEEEYERVKTNLEEKTNKTSDFKSVEIEINNRLEKLNGLTSHIKKEIKYNKDELNSLKIRDITQTLQALDEGKLPEENEDDFEVQDEEVQREQREMSSDPNAMDIDEKQAVEQSQVQQTDGEIDSMDIDEYENETSNGLPKFSEAQLQSIQIEDVELQIDELKHYVDNAHVDIDVLEEYARRLAEYKKRKLDLNQAVLKRDEVRKNCEELKKKRLDKFMEGFSIISMTLKEMYQMITMGGNAELELVDSLDPFSEGVLFSVMPPKKSWRNISNLSGGEKTLSSLALVFALHKYRPTPLYVMDEIDAALDFRNVSIVANYIKERTKNAQFIVISLRNNMFELAQQLVGIYKNNNMTRSTTLQNIDILNGV